MLLMDVERNFGKFHFWEDSARPGAIIIDDAAWEANLVRVRLPITHVRGAPAVGRVLFHRLAVPQLVAAWRDVVDAGVLGDVLTWDGSFCPRHMNWSRRRPLSVHSWGIAFDINATLNGYGAETPRLGCPGTVRRLVPIFERWGFQWGGRWSTPDGMHFEIDRLMDAPAAKVKPARVTPPSLPPEGWV